MPAALLVSHDPDLIESLTRLAAAAGASLDVVPDAASARPCWRDATLAVVGLDAADGVVAEGLARRTAVVLACAGAPDEAVWRCALACGAEYVASLPDAESWLVERLRDASSDGAGRAAVVGVIGGRGGAGATTFACALALTAARAGLATALVDADPLGGGIDLVLGDAARSGEVDASGAAGAAGVARAPGLTVVSWSRNNPAEMDGERLAAMVQELARPLPGGSAGEPAVSAPARSPSGGPAPGRWPAGDLAWPPALASAPGDSPGSGEVDGPWLPGRTGLAPGNTGDVSPSPAAPMPAEPLVPLPGLVVVDIGRSLAPSARAAFAALDTLLVVTPAEVRACASTARLAGEVTGYVGDVRVVVRAPAPSRLAGDEVARAVGLPLAAWLPAEPGIASALERGEPPGRRGRGPLAQACRALLPTLVARDGVAGQAR